MIGLFSDGRLGISIGFINRRLHDADITVNCDDFYTCNKSRYFVVGCYEVVQCLAVKQAFLFINVSRLPVQSTFIAPLSPLQRLRIFKNEFHLCRLKNSHMAPTTALSTNLLTLYLMRSIDSYLPSAIAAK